MLPSLPLCWIMSVIIQLVEMTLTVEDDASDVQVMSRLMCFSSPGLNVECLMVIYVVNGNDSKYTPEAPRGQSALQ